MARDMQPAADTISRAVEQILSRFPRDEHDRPVKLMDGAPRLFRV